MGTSFDSCSRECDGTDISGQRKAQKGNLRKEVRKSQRRMSSLMEYNITAKTETKVRPQDSAVGQFYKANTSRPQRDLDDTYTVMSFAKFLKNQEQQSADMDHDISGFTSPRRPEVVVKDLDLVKTPIKLKFDQDVRTSHVKDELQIPGNNELEPKSSITSQNNTMPKASIVSFDMYDEDSSDLLDNDNNLLDDKLLGLTDLLTDVPDIEAPFQQPTRESDATANTYDEQTDKNQDENEQIDQTKLDQEDLSELQDEFVYQNPSLHTITERNTGSENTMTYQSQYRFNTNKTPSMSIITEKPFLKNQQLKANHVKVPLQKQSKRSLASELADQGKHIEDFNNWSNQKKKNSAAEKQKFFEHNRKSHYAKQLS